MFLKKKTKLNCSVSGMSALKKSKRSKKVFKFSSRLVCAVLDIVDVDHLSNPNRLNDLEYRRAANDEEEESKQPWSNA